MNYHVLGKSKITVSEIAFGCMSLGADHQKNKSLLQEALDRGITFFDTADLYAQGDNEVTLGKAFAGMRSKVISATKAGNQPNADGNGWSWNPSKKYILEAIEKSLVRLQTDYIDLYQLHGGTTEDPIDETIEAFELLKQQGKIRAYGISSIRPNVIREYVKRSGMDSVMMQYSLLDRRPEESCFALLHQNNISVLTRGSMAQGLLINKPATTYLNYSAEEVNRVSDAVHSLKDHSPLGATLLFASAAEAVTSIVTGIRNRAQLESILLATNEKPLSEKEMTMLTSAVAANQYEQHR